MDSPYVKEYALVKKRHLSAEYVTMNHENVRRHMEPYPAFQGAPFRNIREAPEGEREKGELSPAEVSRIITSPVRDPWARLAVLLGILCGIRRGESSEAI